MSCHSQAYKRAKNSNKNTKKEKAKEIVSLVFTKKVNNKKVTTRWTCLVGHWLSCLNSSSLCAGLNSASLKDGMGEEYLFLKICGKILRTKGKLKRQKKSWEAVCQKGLKKQKLKDMKIEKSTLPKKTEETEIKRYKYEKDKKITSPKGLEAAPPLQGAGQAHYHLCGRLGWVKLKKWHQVRIST